MECKNKGTAHSRQNKFQSFSNFFSDNFRKIYSMALNKAIIAELEHEAAGTRRVINNLPEENLDWRPHEKSYTIGYLAQHVTQLPVWVVMTIKHPELDLSKGFDRKKAQTKADILALFEEHLATAKEALQNVSDEEMEEKWTLRNGDHVIFTLPKKIVLRYMVLNHIVHHRGQLTVYLRLLNIPVPGLYGPSADEK
jgi:uncharacterized damage-inducible protein DinB